MKMRNGLMNNSIFLLPLILLGLSLTVGGFVFNYTSLSKGNADLRNRIVGARLLMAGEDPYFFKWTAGMPEDWIDPWTNPQNPATRVTVPPTILMLHSPVSDQNIANQEVIWFFVQWLLLLATVVLLVNCTGLADKQKFVLVLGLLFAGSFSWIHHVRNGQIYILYVFLVTSAYWINVKLTRGKNILAGFILGITASLRPPYALMIILALLRGKTKIFLSGLTGVLVAFSISLKAVGLNVWKSYFSAITLIGTHSLKRKTRGFNASDFYPAHALEGITPVTSNAVWPPYNGSIKGFMEKTLGIDTPVVFLAIGLILLVGIFVYLLHKKYRSQLSPTQFFLVGTTLVIISEFFIPAGRYSYYDIQWLVPLSLIAIAVDMSPLAKSSFILLTMLLLGAGWFFINPAINTWLITCVIVGIIFKYTLGTNAGKGWGKAQA